MNKRQKELCQVGRLVSVKWGRGYGATRWNAKVLSVGKKTALVEWHGDVKWEGEYPSTYRTRIENTGPCVPGVIYDIGETNKNTKSPEDRTWATRKRRN